MPQILLGWKETTLGNIGRIITGKTPSTKDDSFWGGGTPFITPTDISNSSRYCTTERTLTQKATNQLRSLILPKNSICYTSIASIGLLCLTQEESLTNQQINSIIVNDDNNYSFYYYYLIYITPFLKKIAGGTTTNIINKSQFEKIPIICPHLPEQQAIAAVLSSFDDKIELLRAENQTLEQMGQELFKERFGKWKIGDDLPEGWRVGKLGEMGTIICGKTPSKNNGDFFGGNIPFIKIPDMHGNLFILKTEDSLTEEGADSQKNKYISEGAICVSCIATVGLVSLTTKSSQTNQQINSIIPKFDNYREYLYYSLASMKNELLAIGAGGSATLNINTTTFSNISIIIPDQETLSKFDLVIKPLFNKIRTNSEQIQTLSATRDQLLPKLMSGEVRVEF